MHKQRDLLNKSSLPTSKSWSDILEDPSISLFPNTPTGNDHNLKETWAFKRFLCNPQRRNRFSRRPWDL
jgi:hypothetical protein